MICMKKLSAMILGSGYAFLARFMGFFTCALNPKPSGNL